MNPFRSTNLSMIDIDPSYMIRAKTDILDRIQKDYPDDYKKYGKYMTLDTTITCNQLFGMGKSLSEVVDEGYDLLVNRIEDNFYKPD